MLHCELILGLHDLAGHNYRFLRLIAHERLPRGAGYFLRLRFGLQPVQEILNSSSLVQVPARRSHARNLAKSVSASSRCRTSAGAEPNRASSKSRMF